MIGEKGVSGISVMEVCDIAGVGRTSFYNYFDDADQLVSCVSLETAEILKNRFDELHEHVNRGLARLEKCLEMLLKLAVDDRDAALLITSLSHDGGAGSDLLYREIEQELAGAVHAGELNMSKNGCTSLARFLTITTMAICREFALGRLERDQINPQLAIMLNACR